VETGWNKHPGSITTPHAWPHQTLEETHPCDKCQENMGHTEIYHLLCRSWCYKEIDAQNAQWKSNDQKEIQSQPGRLNQEMVVRGTWEQIISRAPPKWMANDCYSNRLETGASFLLRWHSIHYPSTSITYNINHIFHIDLGIVTNSEDVIPSHAASLIHS